MFIILQHCLGYGACAINPYLAQESIKELIDMKMLDKIIMQRLMITTML